RVYRREAATLAVANRTRYAVSVPMMVTRRKKGTPGVWLPSENIWHMDVTERQALPANDPADAPERQADTMATLLETSAAVAASLDLDALLDKILDAIGRLVPSERVSVILDVPGRDVLRIVCARGEPGYAEQLIGQERPVTGSLTGQVYRTG